MVTVAELHADREARAQVNHETYKQLWGLVQDRIRARAEMSATSLMWQVPPFVPGRPVYTVSHAARYVADKLRRGGFDVTVAAPQRDVVVLFVSWTPSAPKQHPRPARPKDPVPDQPKSPSRPAAVTGASEETSRTIEKLRAKLRLAR